MGTKKRISDEASNPRRKKAKLSDVRDQENELAFATVLPGEVDFPRGGGTSFTPVEYKSIRAEAIKELNEENVFKVSGVPVSLSNLLMLRVGTSF